MKIKENFSSVESLLDAMEAVIKGIKECNDRNVLIFSMRSYAGVRMNKVDSDNLLYTWDPSIPFRIGMDVNEYNKNGKRAWTLLTPKARREYRTQEHFLEHCRRTWEAMLSGVGITKEEYYKEGQRNGFVLAELNEKTAEDCLREVQRNGLELQFVEEQTPEICLAAVKQCGEALRFVIEQTPVICMEAVKEDCFALRYVREQTPELCKVALNKDAHTLLFVKEQTPELCIIALKHDDEALIYVKDKSPEMNTVAGQELQEMIRNIQERRPEICSKQYQEGGLIPRY